MLRTLAFRNVVRRLVFVGLERGHAQPALPVGTGVSRHLRTPPSGEPVQTMYDERLY